MSQLINQGLAIVVAVKIQNPTFLNEDFLKQTGIVPIEWKLVREPIFADRVAQIMFENGLSIVAQPDRLMFLNTVANSSDRVAKIAAIIANWHQELAEFNQFVGTRFQPETGDRQVPIDTTLDEIKIVAAPELPPVVMGSFN